MTAFYRSQNVFSSQPGNLLALRNIQQDVADSLSVDLDVVELIVDSAYIYEKIFKKQRLFYQIYGIQHNVMLTKNGIRGLALRGTEFQSHRLSFRKPKCIRKSRRDSVSMDPITRMRLSPPSPGGLQGGESH
jgi:hypothetical protein